MSKKAPCFVEFNFFTYRNRRKRFSQNKSRKADLQSVASEFYFLPQDLVMIFQSTVIILPRFSTLKDQNDAPGQNLKNLRQHFVAISMLNKCAKFLGDSPSGKNVIFNLARAIELSETADFVYNFVQKPFTSEQLWWHN